MKWFSKLYDRSLIWARHPKAEHYLGALSFIEAIFFPIPPDVMLAPMVLANPHKAWRYALIASVTSVIGGILGYLLGRFAFLPLVHPLLVFWGYESLFNQAVTWFQHWGFWVILMAGFTPIPYKVFTVAAGTVMMSFPLFVIASAVGRGLRFFFVAGMVRWGGRRFEPLLRRYLDYIGWALVAALLGLWLTFRT